MYDVLQKAEFYQQTIDRNYFSGNVLGEMAQSRLFVSVSAVLPAFLITGAHPF